MRKYLNVLKEAGPMAPGVFDDPLNPTPVDPTGAAPDLSMDDPADDMATAGPVTKVEVTMKDGEEVEVEVYAQQGDELKRLMDLAGMFHKDKQNGTLGADDNAAPDMDIPMDMEPVEEPSVDIGMDPEVSEIPPVGGPDAPVGADLDMDDGGAMDDIAFDMGDDMDDIDSVYEKDEKRHDYGYPNPELGQQDYKIDAFAFSSGASKPVRYVPARNGDNAMVDNSNKKRLQTYMHEISEAKKKELSEESPQDKVANAVNAMTAGVKVDPATQKSLDKIAKERQTGLAPDEAESEIADDVLDAAEQEKAVKPNTVNDLKKKVQDMRKDSTMREQTFALPIVDEDEIEEKKRRYSFSPAEFGRGIVTSPLVKIRKAARRGLGKH